MAKFTVTYERWTQEDIEAGFLFDEVVELDAEELELLCWKATPSVFPYIAPVACAFITVSNANEGTLENIEDGIVENHAYHPADDAAIEALHTAWINANGWKAAA